MAISKITTNSITDDAVTTAKVNPAQTDITSVGTLTGLTVSGDATLTGDNYNVTWDKSENVLKFADNAKLHLGAGNDLRIYHDGSNSYIDEEGTGSLFIRSSRVSIHKYTGETMINAVADGNVSLYYDDVKKLETTANGIGIENGTTYSHNTNFKGIDVGDQAFYGEYDGGSLYIVKNRYYDGSNWIAKENGGGAAINIDTNGDFFIQTSGNVNAGQTGNLTTRHHFNDSGGYYWYSDGHGNGAITMYNNNTYIAANSGSGEVYATDAAGNHSLLSPHNFKYIPEGKSADNAWSYLSEKVTPTDKKDINGNDAKDAERKDGDNFTYVNVDMMKVVREVEKLTGTKLIYTGTDGKDDGSTVKDDIIAGLIKRIEALESK